VKVNLGQFFPKWGNVAQSGHADGVVAVRKQGCQIFLGTTYQNGENIPNDHKMYKVAIKFTN
jgi:hypothetical protein